MIRGFIVHDEGKNSSCATSGCPITGACMKVAAFFRKHIPFLRKREEKASAQALMEKMNAVASPPKQDAPARPAVSEQEVEKR